MRRIDFNLNQFISQCVSYYINHIDEPCHTGDHTGDHTGHHIDHSVLITAYKRAYLIIIQWPKLMQVKCKEYIYPIVGNCEIHEQIQLYTDYILFLPSIVYNEKM